MSDLIVRPTGSEAARARRDVQVSNRALIEFESPSSALITMPMKGTARVTIWVISALMASLVAAAGLIPLDKVVTAQATVVATDGTIVVQPLETSIVRSINVKEGQVVKKGDVLARLDPTFAGSDMAALQAQVNTLQPQVDRLRAEATNQPYRPAASDVNTLMQVALYTQRQAQRQAQLQQFNEQINSLRQQVARDEADIRQYKQRLAVALDLERKRKELERLQVGSQINTLAAVDNRLELERSLADAQQTALQDAHNLQAAIAQRDAYDQGWFAQANTDLATYAGQLSDAKESLKKAQLRHELVELRAEQDAIVQSVAQVSVGSVLQSGDQFLTLVPFDSQLEVMAYVSGADAGYVHPGESVMLKFDTLNFVRYGYGNGTVRTVSADSFNSASPPQTSPTSLGQPQINSAQTANTSYPYYMARITLDELKLHDVPEGFRIRPGMPVTADVKVGKRTVLSYMLERILPVGYDALREP